MLTEAWQELPSDIDTPVLERAMAAPTNFRTNAEYNNFYRARLDYLRVQNTIAVSMAQMHAETEQALARETQVRAETKQARSNAAYNHFYRARLDYLRVQNTIAVSMAQMHAETEQARAETEQARAETAQALAREAQIRARTEQIRAETEQVLAQSARFRERLRAAGIDPDEA